LNFEGCDTGQRTVMIQRSNGSKGLHPTEQWLQESSSNGAVAPRVFILRSNGSKVLHPTECLISNKKGRDLRAGESLSVPARCLKIMQRSQIASHASAASPKSPREARSSSRTELTRPSRAAARCCSAHSASSDALLRRVAFWLLPGSLLGSTSYLPGPRAVSTAHCKAHLWFMRHGPFASGPR